MSCNGCRVLRKGCSDTCLLRPCLAAVEGADAQGHATLFLAKFFGRAGLMGFISAVSEAQRPALFQSLLYEACGRTINPVYGSAGLLWSGQWHLCEAAVDSVLHGNTLQACSPLQNAAEPSAPSHGGHAAKPLGGGALRPASRATSMPAFQNYMVDPAAMAYWPLAMTPMMGAHMAAMGGAASAAAAYQASYQSAGCQPQSYLPSTSTMGMHFHHAGSAGAAQPPPPPAPTYPVWPPSQAPHMAPSSPVAATEAEGVPPEMASDRASPTGGSSSATEACSRMQQCPSPPLVAPVARRLTPQTGLFPQAGRGVGPHFPQVDSAGLTSCNTQTDSSGSAAGMLRRDIAFGSPDWAARTAAEPPSHSLVPLLPG